MEKVLTNTSLKHSSMISKRKVMKKLTKNLVLRELDHLSLEICNNQSFHLLSTIVVISKLQ
jgi:hypothetical protein